MTTLVRTTPKRAAPELRQTPAEQPTLAEPPVLKPYRHDGVSEYYLKETEGTHWFSQDAFLKTAIGLEGMNPAKPTELAPLQPLGDNAPEDRSGPFGGPLLDVRVGERIRLTIDGSNASGPFNLHWHGVHGKNATPDPNSADMLPMMGVGPRLGDEGLGGVDIATAELTLDGNARTRAIHSHTSGKTRGMVGDQVRSGLILPTIIRDDLSDALERRGLPSQLGVDDLPLILQDERQSQAQHTSGNIDTRVGDAIDRDGMLGNHIAVNGTFNPTFDVKSGLMRLRVQNFSSARQIKLAFDNDQDFYAVAGQAGFLSKPIKVDGKDGLLLGPSEGVEIVWQPDASKADANGQVSLISRAFTPDNGMFGPGVREEPDPELERQGRPDQGTQLPIMKFNVPSDLPAPARTADQLFAEGGPLFTLRPLDRVTIADVEAMHLKTRTFRLEGAVLSDTASKIFGALKTIASANPQRTIKLDADSIANLAIFVGGDVWAAVEELKRAGNLEPTGAPDTFAVKDLELTINGSSHHMGEDHSHHEEIPVGTKEVWEVENPSEEPHPFHVHGRRFRIMDVSNVDGTPATTTPIYTGDSAPGELLQEADTINLAPGQKARILVDFADAVPGEMLMLHCHNMEHEDGGMMAMFQFVDAAPDHGGHHHHHM